MTRIYIILALVAVLFGAGTLGLHSYNTALKEAHDQKARADQAEADWKTEHDARYEERAKVEHLEGVLNDAHAKTQQLTAVTRAAERSAAGVRSYADSLAAQCSTGPSTGASGPSQAASAPGPLLAELHRRTDEAAGVFAQYADELRISGSACASLYPDQVKEK